MQKQKQNNKQKKQQQQLTLVTAQQYIVFGNTCISTMVVQKIALYLMHTSPNKMQFNLLFLHVSLLTNKRKL